MKSTKLSALLNAALGLSLGVMSLTAHAATLNNGDSLSITAGVDAYDTAGNFTNVSSGSWFSMDTVISDGKIQGAEKHSLTQGSNGLLIGSAQAIGGIDLPWVFGPNNGQHFTDAAVTGDNVTGLAMTGWKVNWGGTIFPMGGVAWNPGNCTAVGVNCANANSIGKLTWDGVYGHAYVLDYAATVSQPGSSFDGAKYYLHLVGTVVSGSTVAANFSSPTGAQVDSQTTNTVTVTFGENVSGVSTSFLSILSSPGNVPVAINSVTPSVGPASAYTFGIGALAYGTTYNVTFNNTGVTASGKTLAAPVNPAATFSTKIQDVTPPTIVFDQPTSGQVVSPNTSTLQVTFNEGMNVSSVTTSTLNIQPSAGITVSNVVASNSNKTFTYTISGLAAGQSYTASIKNTATDIAGNSVVTNSLAFSTNAKVNPPLVNNRDKLLICSGSKFGMDLGVNNRVYTSITGKNPILIGVAQSGAVGHSGAPNGSENPSIDNPWYFTNNTGMHLTTVPITDNGDSTLNFSGWRVTWNNVALIDMGSGVKASLSWDGIWGGNYTLSYNAVVPLGDPSGFGGVPYTLTLVGKVNGGPSNVNQPCDGLIVSPSGVQMGVTVAGAPSAAISLLEQIRPDDNILVSKGYSAAGRPSGLDFYKFGALDYQVTGLTANAGQIAVVTLSFPEIPTGSRLYKITSRGYEDITNYSDGVSKVKITGSTVEMTIQDDGYLDDCKTNQGCQAGVIRDPVTLGAPIVTTTSGDASGGGGGGCTVGSSNKFDPSLLSLIFASLGALGWRRLKAKQ